MASTQRRKEKVRCEGQELANVFNFKYLGSIFSADGNHTHDVKRRCAMEENRCGELRHIFNSDNIPMNLKLKIYKVAVCSLMTYGSEVWSLTESTAALLNGCNAR